MWESMDAEGGTNDNANCLNKFTAMNETVARAFWKGKDPATKAEYRARSGLARERECRRGWNDGSY